MSEMKLSSKELGINRAANSGGELCEHCDKALKEDCFKLWQ